MKPSTPPVVTVQPRQFCKARKLASRFGVCPKTIFRWADDGKIARFKINDRVVLFDEAEVSAFIEGSRVVTSATG